MSMQLKDIVERLALEKKQHGRLKQIAAGSEISERTVYAVANGRPPSAGTCDKLAAYFTKLDRKIKKEKSE